MTRAAQNPRTEQRRKWDERHRNAAPDAPEPCAALRDCRQLLPAAGAALDLACGRGGNALFLARRGLLVTACDFSGEALRQLEQRAAREALSMQYHACTAEEILTTTRLQQVITVSRFLQRDLVELILQALAPRGLLYYQTFTTDHRGKGPRNPDYLLRPNELRQLFRKLELLYYREERDAGIGPRELPGQACLVGRRPPLPRTTGSPTGS